MKLGDLLVRIEAGRSLACEPRRAEADEWAVIKVSAMTSGVFRPEEAKPLPAGVRSDPLDEIREGDLLISRANTTAYVGASVLVPRVRPRLLMSDKSLRLVPKPDVNPRWLHLMLQAPEVRRAISEQASGTKDSMRNITQRALLELDMPEVALEEQSRIVAVLEGHLSRLDAARAYVDAAVRRSRSAEQALIDEIFVVQAQAEQWPRQGLADFATGPRAVTDGPFGSNLTSAHYAPDGALVLRLQNIGDGHFKQAEAFITLEHYDALRVHDVRKGDVVIASLGEELPRAALVPDLGVPAIVKADCIRVRPDADVDPRWLVYACRSRPAKRHASDLVKGVGRQRLGLKGIRSIPVPRLPRTDQERHLDRLEEQLSELARLQAATASGHVRGDALQRSLLTAAFAGGF